MVQDKISNKILELRLSRDITQEELAKILGVSRQTIISIEKGKYVPSLQLAFKLAKFFDTTIEQIFSI